MKSGFTHESTFSESKEWYTPVEVFKAIGLYYDLDPCSPGPDIAPWIPAKFHFTIKDNGLDKQWFGKVYMNPPYGSDTPLWLAKLAGHGDGIALVFARTDTRWFHEYIPRAEAICFIKGRIQFIDAPHALEYAAGQYKPKNGGCGAASMLIAYGSTCADALYKSSLGITLPVGKALEMFRTQWCFAGGCLRPNENQPQLPGSGQSNFTDKLF